MTITNLRPAFLPRARIEYIQSIQDLSFLGLDFASVETNATGPRSFTLSLSCALARETPKKVEKVPATADVDALSTVVSACVSIPCEDLVWFFFLCGFCAILVCHALRLGFREGSRGCRVCFTRCISRMGGCVNLGDCHQGIVYPYPVVPKEALIMVR